ncbi:protein NIM1-INTERACTING 2-like [Actinidia eriantha]|uniref:protein NIM1-INTERACTING 2-like n=1 Tax=Actinidia eriantha TaxID=165200 RepID=UPI002583EFD9|nr:protein NIM1-INTERACTING 2-like [Actinidia eriantha]
MEGEKKRKRAVDGGGRRNKAEAEAAPSEEEIEEFFAILRRMHVAVQYFEKGNGNSNSNVDGRKLTGRTAIEAEALAGTDDVKAGEESVIGARKNGVWDLNAVPEEESQ